MDNPSLHEILAAKEARANLQAALAEKHRGAGGGGGAIVSYTLNIAGPRKRSPLADRSFHAGVKLAEVLFRRLGYTLAECVKTDAPTGLECLWVVHGDAALAVADAGRLKTELCRLEDEHPLGRLFDMDVIGQDGQKLSRGGTRPCLICDRPGHDCARNRTHPAEEVAARTHQIMEEYFAAKDARFIADCATRALLYELAATPKPGLVDRANNGSHADMGFFTFVDSAAALVPYFAKMAKTGAALRGRPPGEMLAGLRPLGIAAEEAMYAATGGANTHKGAIFSLGIVCAAAGRLGCPLPPYRQTLALAGQIAAPALRDNLADKTNGERVYRQYGLAGIRGEAAGGFASVSDVALPALHAALERGATIEEAGIEALLRLIATAQDTNMITRCGGEQAAAAIRQELAAFLESRPSGAQIIAHAEKLDESFIKSNISPGGCADLLALTYFMHLLGKDWEESYEFFC
ncbi:MAG: citrate lyase holo-[acyl-carrier protein] synthase [Spirochaetes bacterium]|nr:citrate lyase holo-[acyl-carrier protein] synthase [Spirochaetota bacterium]